MHFDWGYFWTQLITPSSVFLYGLGLTVLMGVSAQMLGFVFGLVLAFGRLSRNKFFNGFASAYIWVVRGTPLLVQIVFIYSGLAAAGILNFHDITLFGVTFPGNVQAGILALAVNEAAYMAEIFRAGINAVEKGQFEAAKALGMPPSMMMRHVVLPQAFRVILLPIGNQFNIMLKNTTLVSVIGVSEMLLVTETINSATFRTFELYSVSGDLFLASHQSLEPVHGLGGAAFRAGTPIADVAARRACARHIGGSGMSELLIEATGVEKWFGPVKVLDRVDFSVKRGEVVVLIGPSGSGKTTLLRCINHLETVQNGRIAVNGALIGYRQRNGKLVSDAERNIAVQRRDVGMVFQRFNLFQNMSVLKNISLAPILLRGTKKADAEAQARTLLAAGRIAGQGGGVSGGTVGRAAATRGDCPGARHAAGAPAVR